jgi:hypothetical protein
MKSQLNCKEPTYHAARRRARPRQLLAPVAAALPVRLGRLRSLAWLWKLEGGGTAIKKRIVTLGISGVEVAHARPADFPRCDCSPCWGLHVHRESLGFIHRSRGGDSSQFGAGDALGGGRRLLDVHSIGREQPTCVSTAPHTETPHPRCKAAVVWRRGVPVRTFNLEPWMSLS